MSASVQSTDHLWERCLNHLARELEPGEMDMWLRPLHARCYDDELLLLAPNTFVRDHVTSRYRERIEALVKHYAGDDVALRIMVGSSGTTPVTVASQPRNSPPPARALHRLDSRYRFDNFVEGKSNQLARAAANQVGDNPGIGYNPLLLYGGTGLGKTHLLHAVGHRILELNPSARILYMQSEEFVNGMIKALRHGTIDQFKARYRSLDALLIDDIQFFAGKERSQEEFFHTFNKLFEDQQQIVLTCDRYPKEVDGIDKRLQSRFGWGLNVSIEPPDFETRVAILMNKAATKKMSLSENVVFFIAKRIRSNVRDLEGALNTLRAHSQFLGVPITENFARDALSKVLEAHQQAITLPNIQKVVADYYGIKMAHLLSKSRKRSLARPRQVAMALAKELTDHSLPEIGHAFGGRDHTTVLHACRRIKQLRKEDPRLDDDWAKLVRALSA